MNTRSLLGLAALCVLAPGLGAQSVLTYDPAAGELPVGVAVDKTGNIWVSLEPLCQVRRYTPGWEETLRVTLVDDCSNGAGAGGLAIDATGLAFVAVRAADDQVREVYVVDESGAYERLPDTEQAVFPNSLAFDHHNGTLYVSDMVLGAVWRIPPRGTAELWIQHPMLVGVPAWPGGPPLGANGIAVHQGYVTVSVSFTPRLVRIPILEDGSAGAPTMLYAPPAFFGAGIFAIDDIALDVHGDVHAAVVAGAPPTVIRLKADGTGITRLDPLPASATSLAFGTGMGERESLFVAINQAFGGVSSGIVRMFAGVPGRPLP